MANQSGEIKVGNEIVGYFQFSRTSGMASTRIYPSLDDLRANWRTQGRDRKCTCPEIPPLVELSTDGHVWTSRACLKCMAIAGNPDPQDNTGAFLSQCYSNEEIDKLKREWGWIG